MSTNNIGFYEDLTKIIFELSSNIIIYAPYFFCCKPLRILDICDIYLLNLQPLLIICLWDAKFLPQWSQDAMMLQNCHEK